MPFTIGGQWVPSKSSMNDPAKPVKVRVVKRGKSILTVILNLKMTPNELNELASTLKKKLGCGGGIQDCDVEIQGDKLTQVKAYLQQIGIKSQ